MSEGDVGAAFQFGVFVGIVIGALFYALLDCVSACLCCRRFGNVSVTRSGGSSTVVTSGFSTGLSVVQSNGRVWINGQEVDTGNTITSSCTKSLRITADGEVLNHRLQPGTPIHIKADPGVVFNGLEVGDDLHVTGNIEGNGTLKVGDNCTIQGNVTLHSLNAGDDLRTGPGNVTCTRIRAGDDITVSGDLYCDQLEAGDDVVVHKQRKRRSSFR